MFPRPTLARPARIGARLAVSVSFLLGCDPPDPTTVADRELQPPVRADTGIPDPIPQLAKERFHIDGPDAIDLLFVSCDLGESMDDAREKLAQSTPTLVGALEEAGVDYHIGAATIGNGRLHSFRLYPYFSMAVDDPAALGAMMRAVNGVGLSGMSTVYTALELMSGVENRDFRRMDESTHVVVMCTADDTLRGVLTKEEFELWFPGMRQDDVDVTFSSIVPQSSAGPDWAYVDWADRWGGITFDLDSADYGPAAEQLAELVKRPDRDTFVLQGAFDAETLTVVVVRGAERFALRRGERDDGGTVVRGEWVYDADDNALRVVSFAFEPDDVVEITYELP